MATGDVTVFDEAKAKMIEGDWSSTDTFYCAIVDATVTPTASFLTPVWADFSANEVTNAGSYTTGGHLLGALSALVTETGGTMTFKSLEVDPTWTQDPLNATDATWAILYNNTAPNDAIGFVELGTVNMATGALTITWDTNGIYTIT